VSQNPTPLSVNALRDQYRDGLLSNVLPFWFPRCVDAEHGGYFTAMDPRAPSSIPKVDLVQGRIAWMLATLYNTVEHAPMARLGPQWH